MTNIYVWFKHLTKISLISLLVFSVACSKKKNTTEGGVANNQFSIGLGSNSDIMGIANQNCHGRRAPTRYFYTQATNNSYPGSLSGSFVRGTVGGHVLRRYFGVNSLGDAIEVNKMASGNSVVGYNILVSLCDAPVNNTSLYIYNRDILSIQGSLSISESNSCIDGNVVANLIVMLEPYSTTVNNYPIVLNSVSFQVPFAGHCQTNQNQYYY